MQPYVHNGIRLGKLFHVPPKPYYPADGIYDSPVLRSHLNANYTDTNSVILFSLLFFL